MSFWSLLGELYTALWDRRANKGLTVCRDNFNENLLEFDWYCYRQLSQSYRTLLWHVGFFKTYTMQPFDTRTWITVQKCVFSNYTDVELFIPGVSEFRNVRAIPVLEKRQCYTLALGSVQDRRIEFFEQNMPKRVFQRCYKSSGSAFSSSLPPYTLRRFGDEMRQFHSRKSPDVVLDQQQLWYAYRSPLHQEGV